MSSQTSKRKTIGTMTNQEIDALVSATPVSEIDDDILCDACRCFLTFEWGTENQKAEYPGGWRHWTDAILAKAEHEGRIDTAGIMDCIMDDAGWGS